MLLLGITIVLTMGFQCGGPPAPPPVGFQLHTMDEDDLFSTLEDSPDIGLVGNLQEVLSETTQGQFTYFSGSSDDNGYYEAVNAIVPANWEIGESGGPCDSQSTVVSVGNQDTQDLDCIATVLGFYLVPGQLYESDLPASLEITGTGMSTTYGMPHVEIFNEVGTVIANVTASSVIDNGTVLTAPTPKLSNLPTATYGLEVLNVQSNGTLAPVGATPVAIIYTPPYTPPTCPTDIGATAPNFICEPT